MARRLGKPKSESSAKKLNLKGQKLSTENMVISHERQKQLNNMLLEAAKEGNAKRAERLLKAGASIGAKEEGGHGLNALMLAVFNGRTETCALLIGKGANANAKNYYGMTALMWAADMGHYETCALLIDKGADITAASKNGMTAFSYGRKEMAEFLKIYPTMKALGKEADRFISAFKECIGQ